MHVPFKSYDDFKFTTNRDTKFYILSYGQLNRMSPKCNFYQQLQLLSKYFDRTYTKYYLTEKLKFSQIFTFLPIYPYISKHYLPTSASFAHVGSHICAIHANPPPFTPSHTLILYIHVVMYNKNRRFSNRAIPLAIAVFHQLARREDMLQVFLQRGCEQEWHPQHT